jgi:hypothetical protein
MFIKNIKLKMKGSSMSTKNIIYVGLDVDDTAFHGAGIIRETGEIFEFKCKPDHGVLRKQQRAVHEAWSPLRSGSGHMMGSMTAALPTRKGHEELYLAVRATHPCNLAKGYNSSTAESWNTLRSRSEADIPSLRSPHLRNLSIDERITGRQKP